MGAPGEKIKLSFITKEKKKDQHEVPEIAKQRQELIKKRGTRGQGGRQNS